MTSQKPLPSIQQSLHFALISTDGLHVPFVQPRITPGMEAGSRSGAGSRKLGLNLRRG